MVIIPVKALSPTGKKIVKVWSVKAAVAAAVAVAAVTVAAAAWL